jgi:hypothetical protein
MWKRAILLLSVAALFTSAEAGATPPGLTGRVAPRAGGNLQLVKNTPRMAREYLDILLMFRRNQCHGDLGSTGFWLRKAETLGAQLGRKPLPEGFKQRVLRGGMWRDMQHGLADARASKLRGNPYGMALGLSRTARMAISLGLSGDRLAGILRSNGLTPGDLARHTDYRLQGN